VYYGYHLALGSQAPFTSCISHNVKGAWVESCVIQTTHPV